MSFGAPPTIPTQFQIYNSYVEDPKWQRKFTIIWASFLALAVRKRVEGVLRTLGAVLFWSPLGVGLDLGQIIVVVGYMLTVILCIILQAPLIDNPNRAGFLAVAQLPVVFLFATKNSLLSLVLGPGHGYEKLNYVHRWAGRGMFIGAVVHGALWIRNHVEYGLPVLGPQKETSGVAAFALLCLIVLTSLRPIRVFFHQVFFYLHVLTYCSFFITLCYHTTFAPPWIFPPLAFYGLDILMRMLRYRIKDATLVPVGHEMTLIHVHDCDAGWLAGQHVRLRVFFEGRVFESHPLTILCAPPATSCLSASASERTLTLGARAQGDWTRALHRYATKEAARAAGGKGKPKAKAVEEEKEGGGEAGAAEVQVQVMLDGPYGGCSLDLGEYESVFLVAGGAGATFTLGLLDDIVGRCVRRGRAHGERTRRIEFVWAIRGFGACFSLSFSFSCPSPPLPSPPLPSGSPSPPCALPSARTDRNADSRTGCVDWFAPMLAEIAHAAAAPGSGLDLHVSIFVTCLCNPEALPPIPNSVVSIERPSVAALLKEMITPPPPRAPSREGEGEAFGADAKGGVERVVEVEAGAGAGLEAGLGWVGEGGGVAVCASGPESMTREAHNAVARLGVRHSRRMGGIALHTEVFSL
ncbi:hypothetical protein OF83DRAFT_1145534 [Amylostereum chailletii]|nr:hypothetical protein OF83DRAFT_1145534 [Amylostereum chailletii]